MLPIGLLMKEHRLIERAVALWEKEARSLRRTGKPDKERIGATIDFMRIYADECHHGKEEGILFAKLSQKQMTPEHRGVMEGLISDHVAARKLIATIEAVMKDYLAAQAAADVIAKHIDSLASLYNEHIQKEDNGFFLPAMNYLTDKEKEVMLRKCYDFDAQMIHRLYQRKIEKLEKR